MKCSQIAGLPVRKVETRFDGNLKAVRVSLINLAISDHVGDAEDEETNEQDLELGKLSEDD
jgi:hypothetical protein